MADSGYPNYLTVSPDGSVEGVFPGGIEIKAGVSGTPPNERRVRWVREADGSLVADIFAMDLGTDSRDLMMRALDGATNANILLEAKPVSDHAQVTANAIDSGGAVAATLIDSDGASSFLQLLGLAKRKISFGTANLVFTAAQISPALAINHGLGVVPLAVLAISNWVVSSGIDVTCSGFTNAKFDAVGAFMFGPTTGNVPISWLAIG